MRSIPAFLVLMALAVGDTASADGYYHDTLAARFVQTLVAGPGTLGEPESLVYGNAEYGYFETRELKPNGGQVSARIVPPGYRFPLAVYLKQRDENGALHLERFSDAQFVYPLTASEYAPAPFALDGELSSPFFVGNADIPIGGKAVLATYVVNRQGEVVWLYQNQLTRFLSVTKPLGKGLYGIQNFKEGRFDVVDFDGTVKKQFSSGGTAILHHDFLYHGGDELLALGFRGFDFAGSPHSVLEPERYAVGRILRVNLVTQHMSVLWDAFDDGPWLHGPGWNQKAHSSALMDVGPGAPARQDFDHVNSIDWSPGRGYLLSLRNFNTIVLLDDNFRLRWSLGSAPGTTMDTRGTDAEFYRQHHATFLPDGDILLFDNGRTQSRALQIQVDDQAQTFSLVTEFLPEEPLHSKVRGSLYRLGNGHTVVLFPGAPPQPEATRLIEFGLHGKQAARMTIPAQAMSHGYRATPIAAIGRETYLGPSPRGEGLP